MPELRETASTALVSAPDVTRMHRFILRKNMINILGQKFRIFDEQWNLVLFARLKAFKLKEDIRVYADETEAREVLSIKARQILDLGASYDVVESAGGKKIGVLRRKFWASLARDQWTILDESDREVGMVQEDSLFAALIRRFLLPIIPQSYTITLGGKVVGDIRQHFNPFVFRATMDLTQDPDRKLHRLLGVAAGILLLAIEGRQQSS